MIIDHIPGAHLIQETKDPLNKKFQCKHCGNSFRTRQGLSGHIQFKHSKKKNALAIAAEDMLDIKIRLKAIEGIINLPKPTAKMISVVSQVNLPPIIKLMFHPLSQVN